MNPTYSNIGSMRKTTQSSIAVKVFRIRNKENLKSYKRGYFIQNEKIKIIIFIGKMVTR